MANAVYPFNIHNESYGIEKGNDHSGSQDLATVPLHQVFSKFLPVLRHTVGHSGLPYHSFRSEFYSKVDT